MTIRQNDELNSNPIVVLEEWKNKFKQVYDRDDNVNNYDELFYRDVTRIVHDSELEMDTEHYNENGEINGDITFNELQSCLAKLKNNKACGIDGIPNEILKNPKILNILLHFMNMCFKFNIVPSLWVKNQLSSRYQKVLQRTRIPLNYRGIRGGGGGRGGP